MFHGHSSPGSARLRWPGKAQGPSTVTASASTASLKCISWISYLSTSMLGHPVPSWLALGVQDAFLVAVQSKFNGIWTGQHLPIPKQEDAGGGGRSIVRTTGRPEDCQNF